MSADPPLTVKDHKRGLIVALQTVRLELVILLFWLTDKYGEGPYCRMGWVKASVDNIHIYVKYPLDDFLPTCDFVHEKFHFL